MKVHTFEQIMFCGAWRSAVELFSFFYCARCLVSNSLTNTSKGKRQTERWLLLSIKADTFKQGKHFETQ